MTEETRESKALAEIKARENNIRDQIYIGAREVVISPGSQFTPAQIGLRPVWTDNQGRLWRDDGDRLTKIGYAASRPA